MPSTTRLVIEQDVVRVFAPDDEAVSRLDVPLTTTDTAANTAGVRDTALGRGTSNANQYDARDIKVVELVGSGPAVGEITRVDDAGFDNIDLATVSPTFTAALESGADYIMYPRGLAPEIPVNAINDVLRNTEGPHIWIPSIIDDADFGEADLTNWAAVGTPSTRAFVSTAGTDEPNVYFGERALHIIADAASEGATSNSAEVHENETLRVWTVVRCNVGSCIVQLYNVTASAVIGDPVTVDEQALTTVYFTETVPDDCEQIAIRYLSVASADDFYVSPFVTVQPTGGRTYPAPSWLTTETQIIEAFYVPPGFTSEDADSYVTGSKPMISTRRPTVVQSVRDLTPLYIQLGSHIRSGPLALLVKRGFSELSSETTTTNADRDYVAKKAVANILKARGEGAWRMWASQAAKIACGKRYGRRFVMEENPLVAV